MQRTSNLLLFVLIVSALSCCTYNEMPVCEKIEENSYLQEIVELAIREADSRFKSESRTERHFATVANVLPISRHLSRSLCDTVMYVVNFEDDNGFVLISAKESDNPVVAVIPHGSFDPSEGSENPGFNLFLEIAIYGISSDSIGVRDPIKDEYQMTVDGQYVKTEKKVVKRSYGGMWLGDDFKWGQSGIYSKYCPNKLVGCAPLAVASILVFMNSDEGVCEEFEYTYDNADVRKEVIDWRLLFNHKNTNDCNNNLTCKAENKEIVHSQIARICRQVGHDCQADYSDKYATSVGFDEDMAYALNKHLPTGAKVFKGNDFNRAITDNEADLNIYLMLGRPKKGQAHVWVCDGSYTVTIEYKEYRAYPPAPGMDYAWKLYRTYTKEYVDNYMHWGWDGKYDGWYNYSYVDPIGNNNPYLNITYIAIGY